MLYIKLDFVNYFRVLVIYPKGDVAKKGQSFSFYLQLDRNHPNKTAVYAECKLRILAQVSGKHVEKLGNFF